VGTACSLGAAKSPIAIVDGSAALRRAWAKPLLAREFEVVTAADLGALEVALAGRSCGVVVCDAKLAGRGVRDRKARWIYLLEEGDAALALEDSAFAFLPRSESPPAGVAALLSSALGGAPKGEPVRAKAVLPPEFVASSTRMREVMSEVTRAAASSHPAVLLGEPGVGKRTLARLLLGARTVTELASSAMVPVGEAELEQAYRQAEGGALLIEGLQLLEPAAQARLAALLKLAGPRAPRVVATAAPELRELREAGRFRAELFFAFARHVIDVPSLRERRDDIPVMAAVFVKLLMDRLGLPPKRLNPNVLRGLRAEAWPGNIPELWAAVDTAVMVAGERDRILRSDFAALKLSLTREARTIEGAIPPFADVKADAIGAVSRTYLDSVLSLARGNQSQAAKLAGLDRANFRRLERALPESIEHPEALVELLESTLARLRQPDE
jgi:DNA-binding NtrC family response regulator